MTLRPLLLAGFICTISTVTVFADIYRWTDDKGTVHFTEDPAQVPAQQRKSARQSFDDETAQPPETPADTDNNAQPPAATDENAQPPAAEDGKTKSHDETYSFTTREQWQREISSQGEALDAMFQELEDLSSRFQTAPNRSAEKRELAISHQKLLNEYNDRKARFYRLVEAARKAGFEVNLKK